MQYTETHIKHKNKKRTIEEGRGKVYICVNGLVVWTYYRRRNDFKELWWTLTAGMIG